MPASNENHARVTKVLVQALGVEEDEVKPSATLQGDLGAESIDFLDITFRLEREFGIKIPSGELFPDQAAPALTRDGHLTDEGLAALRSQMPYADLTSLDRDRHLININDLFTVNLLTSYIGWKLGHHDEADTDAQPTTPVSLTPTYH
jgi:acyl carrier protein